MDFSKILPDARVEMKGKDTFIYSANREATKSTLEKYLTSKRIKFKSVFKASKSGSLNVLNIDAVPGDVVFKPIRARGAGGFEFEDQLLTDLTNYFNGVDISDLTHSDVVKELQAALKLKPSNNFEVKKGNIQRRVLSYSPGAGITLNNNSGKYIADLTVVENNIPKFYLSLKKGSSFYILNGAVLQYFLDNKTKKQINEYFGFDGKLMGGFGKEFEVETAPRNISQVKRNLADVLEQALGHNLVIVHKKNNNDVYVRSIGGSNSVTISNVDDGSYKYPEQNVRKYANINFLAIINGTRYEVNMQFRGTTATDKGPKYLRVLLERL